MSSVRVGRAPGGEGAVEVLELRTGLDDDIDRRQRNRQTLGAPRLRVKLGLVRLRVG